MGCCFRCLERNQVPAVFLEPYIKHGYRTPNKSAFYYILSLFSLHNELLNMWTALFSILIHLYLFTLCPVIDTLWTLNFAGLCIHVFSFMAHTYSHMNPKIHIALYLLDFTGIYMGFAQVFPSFLVLHLNVPAGFGFICGLCTAVWNMVIYRNCCAMYSLYWTPWLDGGSARNLKPRVLFFVKKSVWLYVLFWLGMNLYMLRHPPPSGSNKLHLMAILALFMEGALLHTRFPECVFPDYFSVFRSHPVTHVCAGAVTVGLVTGFIADRSHLGDTQLHSDHIFLAFSTFNILFCFCVAATTINHIMRGSEKDQTRGVVLSSLD